MSSAKRVCAKLWMRKLSCGHTRPTNLAYISGNYTKPKIKDGCFCRLCNENVDIVKVEEANKELQLDMKAVKKKYERIGVKHD